MDFDTGEKVQALVDEIAEYLRVKEIERKVIEIKIAERGG